MVDYAEIAGLTLISNATDREGDPITVYSINGSPITWSGLEVVTIVSGALSVNVSENGTVTATPVSDANSPADAATTLYGTFTYTLWDGITEGASRTCDISLKGATVLSGSSPYVLTGLVLELSTDAGVTGSAPVTAWQDQAGSKSFTAVGTPSLGTPIGGTATNTMVMTTADTGFTSTDLTDIPTSSADRTMQFIWKPISGFGYCGLGYGSELFGQAFVLSVDNNGELAFDYYGARILLGVSGLTNWNVFTARLSSGTLSLFLGAAKVYEAAVALVTGTTSINVCQTFSQKTVLAESGDAIIYGRALSDAEIIANVAVMNGRFIGNTTVVAPGTPAGSNVAAASFDVGGTVGESYGNVRWAVKAGTGAMTEAEIIAGTGALAFDVAPINNVASWSASVTGAAASTVYRCHAVFYDLVGGKSSVVTSADITTSSTDSTAPVLTSASGNSGTSSTTATVSVTSDEGNGDAVWGVYLSTATVPTRAQLRSGTDGDSVALVATGTGTPVVGTIQDTAVGLSPSTTYQVAWQQDDAAGNQSSVAESATFTTAASATTTEEQVDGLHNGATPVGRTSVASLNTVGSLPAGVSLGTGKITFTADDVALSDFDLRGYSVDTNNRTGCSITQSLFDVTGAAKILSSHYIVIKRGSNDFYLGYNDISGGIGDKGDSSLVLQEKSSATISATTSTGVIIEYNKAYNYTNDGFHINGGGLICRWNWFGLSSALGEDITIYSGTPGDYTTGNCIAWERNPGEYYPRVCRTASPTLQPAQATNTDWLKPTPHTDVMNVRASIGTGLVIQNNYVHDNWIQDILDGASVRVGNMNNAIRIQRNNGDLAIVNDIIISGIKNDRNRNTATDPYQVVVGGANFNGPIEVSDMRIGRKANGGYWVDGGAFITVWSNVVDAWTGVALAAP